MFPTLSPHGASYVGGERTGVNLDGVCHLFNEDDWTPEQFKELIRLSKSKLPRLKGGERIDGYLKRKPEGFLTQKDQRFLLSLMPYSNHHGLRKAAEKVFATKCRTIRKFLRVWNWIDTCLALSFEEETEETTHFKMKWWKIVAHDIMSSDTIHHACKKWGRFSLYLQLHYGGSIQPLPVWEVWFPRLPRGTWMEKEPGTLTRKEKALCRILSDKRGLPAGDSVTKSEALDKHRQTLMNNCIMSIAQEADLVMYSGIAAESIKSFVKGHWFKNKTGHISISNSSCYEATRDMGGKRAYILSALRGWLCEVPNSSRWIELPTGESFEERQGVPRWVSVKPPGYDDASDLPSGVTKSTGLLTEDFKDGEQERVGFQLFAWSFTTLVEEGFLTADGKSTGKPLPMTRIAIGEPGCKVRIATKTKAAFIVYGQPFAHAMRELLEFHPALRAGLGSGYQLFEWLKGKPVVPDYVMVGDFDAATDNIQHHAGRISMRILLERLGANHGYATNFVDLLLSPRVIEGEDDVIITSSGCLMGEPGTKIVLTFLALVANCYARRGVPSTNFATAGDDQIDADNDPRELLRYAEASKVTTMVPSEDKWGIFRFSTLYCQQLLDVQEKDPTKSEIPVPKPRLLSPESKTGRGDDDTNPAYGKARQFAKETHWSEFADISRHMTFMFLRNMRPYIGDGPELFLPVEWGGLGLPGIKPKSVVDLLPEWHRSLIYHRENGDTRAKKILSSWSTTRIMHRGLGEVDISPVESLLREFLPIANLDDLGLEYPEHARYREKLSIARREGWVPLSTVLRTVEQSTQYENIWDVRATVGRGFSSIPWPLRTEQLRKFALEIGPANPSELVEPRWFPDVLVLVEGVFGISETTDDGADLEEGEIKQQLVPIMGTSCSPRVFLHYDNNRLILNATSR